MKYTDAVALVKRYGVEFLEGVVTRSVEEAVKVAEYPVAVKVISEEITHKTDRGCVKLNIKDEECLRLDSIMFDNDTRIGVRTVKVYYNGTFKGVLLKNSTVAQSLVDLGIEVSDGSVAITQFRTHSRGNVLTLWNGQELSLLFSNNPEITVVVDYSILENLGEKSEALSYSVVQPTLGKGLSIIVKPGGETQPLKTSLNMLTIVLLAASIAVVTVLLYAFRRKREIIIV